MPVPVAALDADVLVPIVACDFLLRAFDHGLYEPIVSTTVIAEVERALVEDFPHLDPDAIQYRVAAMRVVLQDQIVDAQAADVLTTVNAKDRHIVGAALAAEATIVVTNDARLRAEIAASGLGLRSIDLDAFAVELWDSSRTDVIAVIDAMIGARHRPSVSWGEMVEAIRNHMPAFASRLSGN